jgi:uncharacterized protein YoxC
MADNTIVIEADTEEAVKAIEAVTEAVDELEAALNRLDETVDSVSTQNLQSITSNHSMSNTIVED